ncbi:MAG: hypothetical protein PHV61_01145 [Limnochordia bacterium]|nr:hypothetical protein [Limnochordia bacterium]
MLLGYLFFQLYKGTENGRPYAGKILPAALKKSAGEGPKSVIIYGVCHFAVFGFLEFIGLYASCSDDVQRSLRPVLAKI